MTNITNIKNRKNTENTPTIARATTADPGLTPVRTLHTPYHELGELGRPRVPEWAGHRAVYRAAGRTLYLVETDRLDAAKGDLDALARSGWQVRIEREGAAANITLTRDAA